MGWIDEEVCSGASPYVVAQYSGADIPFQVTFYILSLNFLWDILLLFATSCDQYLGEFFFILFSINKLTWIIEIS
jgi:hypothetical protein